MENDAGNLACILSELPAKTPLLVPDELLASWFPPGVIGGKMLEKSLAAAKACAEKYNCTFDYSANEQCGRFWKNRHAN